MNIFAWVLFGIFTGVVARFLDPQAEKEGIIGPMLLGVVGAIVGAVLANLIFGIGLTGVTLHTFTIAVSGSIILLFIGRIIKQI